MKSPSVRLKIRVRLSNGTHRYVDPVFTGNGKLKPLYAVVDNKHEHHPEGVYYLRFGRDGKYRSIGNDPQLALLEKTKAERTLAAKAAGVAVETIADVTRTPLAQAIEEYLLEVSIHKSRRTHGAYAFTMRLFAECCTVKCVEQLKDNRTAVMTFIARLKERGDAPRTVANRANFLRTFYLNRGIEWPLRRSDQPRFTEKVVSAYSEDDLRKLMLAADCDERDLFQFLLSTGAREQEAQFATWQDIDFRAKTFLVKEKRDLGFTPKDSEEGAIPVPDSLLELLRERHRRYPTSRLIFPTTDGKPNGHLLRILQRVALRAELNCGFCVTKTGRCCSDHACCKQWGLHRFRKTFATYHHESGVSARTIQRWLRHSDLETTLRYLAGSDDTSVHTRDRVNASFKTIAA